MTDPVPIQVAFLTGQSDHRRWALSPEQARFLSSVALPGYVTVPINFPYRDDTPPYRPVPLWRASLSNGRMHMRSRFSAFRAEYGKDVSNLLARAEVTVFIAVSCGMELLRNLDLGASQLESIRIIALGPVARGRPQCETVLIQGRHDWLSRRYFRKADYQVECGHMGYLSNEQVHALCRHRLALMQPSLGDATGARG